MSRASEHWRVTPEGRALGEQLARLAEDGIQKIWKDDGHPDDRCASCAFRLGTVPNGCPQTVLDALKATLEGSRQFLCHMRPHLSCHGWYAGRVALASKTTTVPWEYSPDPDAALAPPKRKGKA